MNEKQQQLTFDKGITNVPSDILCSDNALEESVGMIYDNGEHRVIQKPHTTLLPIHIKKCLHISSRNSRWDLLQLPSVQMIKIFLTSLRIQLTSWTFRLLLR